MEEELQVMRERKVWNLQTLPKNIKPIGCRWVFTVKQNERGDIVRFKARLVAQGFKQVKGETYDESFSPVVNFGIIRFFFSLLIVKLAWSHIQCDIKSAYLYAPLTETIYMSQPPGFSDKENLFCKLEKAIYGLHQSGRQWFFEINKILIKLGFNKFDWGNCIYNFKSNVILLLYVDDIVIFGKRISDINEVIELLKKHFDLKILGKTKKLLGVEFNESEKGLSLHQKTYIRDVCKRYNEFNFPISSLPISKSTVYSKINCPQTDHEINEMKQIPYRNLLGCISFIASRTRPDLNYATNIFSQFQSNPGKIHWDGLLKLLGYIAYTKDFELKLDCNKANIITYSDADFAANRDDRTSLGGQLVLIDKSPIAWRTFKEKCVSLSTMEAEFVAMTEAVKEMTWFNRILIECKERGVIKDNLEKPVLYADNQASIAFLKSPLENYKTKHIDVKLFFIRNLLNEEIFEIKYVKGINNYADIFTKAFTKLELTKFHELFFVKNI